MCMFVKLSFLYIYRLCNPSQVINLEVPVFIYVSLVFDDPEDDLKVSRNMSPK